MPGRPLKSYQLSRAPPDSDGCLEAELAHGGRAGACSKAVAAEVLLAGAKHGHPSPGALDEGGPRCTMGFKDRRAGRMAGGSREPRTPASPGVWLCFSPKHVDG